jgi:eukaryotic-like serine/threonine-protein kinase
VRAWSWVWLYGIGIVVVWMLGPELGDMAMFKEMTLGDTKVQGSQLAEFTADAFALLLFLLLCHRAVSQLPKEGRWSSFLRDIIPPVVILIFVLAGHRVVRALAGPFLDDMDRMIYNSIFLLGAIGVTLWLILALMRSSALLTQTAENVPRRQEPIPSRTPSVEADKPVPLPALPSNTAQPSNLQKESHDWTVRVDPPSQRQKLGRYTVLRELGRGSTSVVYLGKDPTIQRFVALKTIRFDEVDEPSELVDLKRRFFKEVKSAGLLSHPNIVTVFDAGDEQDLGYIAMEVLAGITLKEWCRKENLQPIKQVLELVVKVAEALDHAHSQGVVHRDIKPANIMFTRDGIAKITDFSIARITTSTKTRTDVILGTPSYMSPEQIAGEKVDGRSDLFSLGVVLYELLTGERPFQGESVASLMFQITHKPHRPPAQFRTDLPPCCVAIIDRALCKAAGERYQRGLELAEDLRTCLQTCT